MRAGLNNKIYIIIHSKRRLVAIDSKIAYFRQEVATFSYVLFFDVFIFFHTVVFLVFFTSHVRPYPSPVDRQRPPHRRFMCPVNGSPLNKKRIRKKPKFDENIIIFNTKKKNSRCNDV